MLGRWASRTVSWLVCRESAALPGEGPSLLLLLPVLSLPASRGLPCPPPPLRRLLGDAVGVTWRRCKPAIRARLPYRAAPKPLLPLYAPLGVSANTTGSSSGGMSATSMASSRGDAADDDVADPRELGGIDFARERAAGRATLTKACC